jgi:formylglycine-generating enzyme required for sulfatase activity
MLETRFKIALLLTVLFLTSLPVLGILRGTTPPPEDPLLQAPAAPVEPESLSGNDAPLPDEMVLIPAGPFIQGTNVGGYDEKPQRTAYLDAFWIDRYEVTNHRYQLFVAATGHRKPGPPSRYAKNLGKMRGVNQPIVYVSWDDAEAYCRWRGARLPTEAEWEKAMRGVDGRLWPWGNTFQPLAANWGSTRDGFDSTAPAGFFRMDVSPFGVADGAGNVMEWVADWYGEDVYRELDVRNPRGPDHGVYKVLRGGGYTSTGADVRITSRSKMVPDFRDETIGFRCAKSESEEPRSSRDG